MGNNWPKVKLGNLVIPAKRAQAPVPGEAYRQIGVRLWGEGAYERELLDGAQTKYTQLFRTETGDIIVNKIWARNGSVAVVAPHLSGCYVSAEFPMFTPIPVRLESRWMHWLTKTRGFWAQCDEKSRGTSGKNRIRPEQFLSIEIPLPPIAEQQRIVARIEELAVRLQEARTLREQVRDETSTVWRSGARRIFERAENQSPLRSLVDIVSISGGGTPSKANPFLWSGSTPWITPKDMKVRELFDSIDHISEQATIESAAKLINPGAVLVVVRGMILAHTFPSAVLRVPAAINQDMKALTPKVDILPEYLCAFLWASNDSIVAMVEKSTHDTRKLETPVLLNIKIPVPPIAEQRRILSDLSELQMKGDTLENLQSGSSAELDALMPSILDNAFRGEL